MADSRECKPANINTTVETQPVLKTDQMESASIFGGETGSKGVIHNAQGESFTPLKDAANAKPEPERNDTMKSTINQEGPVTQAGKPPIEEVIPMVPTIFETFDKHYDLILLVGTSPTAEFKVCSRTLARKIEYFDKMLYGPFTERKPDTGDWVVKLPETDQASFKMILDVVFTGKSLPERSDPTTICHLVATIDYFLLHSMTRFQVETWSIIIRNALASNPLSSLMDSPLFSAAWSLGCEGAIERFLKRVTKELYRNAEGIYYVKGGKRLRFCADLRPFTLERRVVFWHSSFVTRMTEIIEPTLTDIMDFSRPKDEYRCKSKEARRPESKAICDNAILGSLTKVLRSNGEVDLKGFGSARFRYLSIDECAKRLLSIKISGVESSWRDHEICNPTQALQTSLKEAHSKFETVSILTDDHTTYLNNQWSKWRSG